MKTLEMKNLLILFLLLIGVTSVKSQTNEETEKFIKQYCQIHTKGEAGVEFTERDGRKYMAYVRSYNGITMGAIFPVDQLMDVVIDENELDCCIMLKGKFKSYSEVQMIIGINGELKFSEGGKLNITLGKECKSDNVPVRLKTALLHYAKSNGAESKSEAF